MGQYEIVEVEFNHKEKGLLKKLAIIYYLNGVEENRELYTEQTIIRYGYTLKTK